MGFFIELTTGAGKELIDVKAVITMKAGEEGGAELLVSEHKGPKTVKVQETPQAILGLTNGIVAFMQLTQTGESAKEYFNAVAVMAIREAGEGAEILLDNGDWQNGGKEIRVAEKPYEVVTRTRGHVPFVQLEEVKHDPNGHFFSDAVGTVQGFFNAAAITRVFGTQVPVIAKEYGQDGDSTIIQLQSGKRAHVTGTPAEVAHRVSLR